MTNCKACVFPDTLPDELSLHPLVQVFGQVVHMQAVENEPPEPETETARIAHWRQLARLDRWTPVPLAEQRTRFLALLRDMRQRGDAYTSQLGMLTLAGLNRRDQPEPHHSILSSLLRHGAIKEQQEDPALWQSRLIVKLGEYYDIEQMELDRALQEIARRENRLLAELCEDGENPFALQSKVTKTDQQTEGILRHRLRAWARLCFHGDRPAPGVLVTSRRTAMELLEETYEKLCRQSPKRLVSLSVPSARTSCGPNSAANDPLVGLCPSLESAWRHMTESGSALPDNKDMEAMLSDGTAQWSRALSALSSPSSEPECWFFDLFFFPGMTAAGLFAKTFGAGRPEQGVPTGLAGCVVGLLRMENQADV